MIARSKAAAVHNHDKFPAGQAPTTLTPAGTKSFVATSDEARTKAFIMAAKSCEKAHLLWRVKVKDSKIYPSQLVLMSRVKVTVPGHGAVVST